MQFQSIFGLRMPVAAFGAGWLRMQAMIVSASWFETRGLAALLSMRV